MSGERKPTSDDDVLGAANRRDPVAERKPTSEIVADLRCIADSDMEGDEFTIALAADRLAELEAELSSREERIWRIDALRRPCPTCGGTREVRGLNHDSPAEPLYPCPDCSDGLMSHERAWKIVAAVMEAWTGERTHEAVYYAVEQSIR